jgi:hypothetical protein
MGISVANAALGGVMTAHHDRAEFEKVRAEAILRRRRLADAGPSSGPMPRRPSSRPITVPPSSGTVSSLPSSGPISSWPSSGPISTRRVP